MKRCFKLIRDDWTDLEYGTTKFAVNEIMSIPPDEDVYTLKPRTAIWAINYAEGLDEWCPMPGAPRLMSMNAQRGIKGTILIEIEPIGETIPSEWENNGIKFKAHSCKSCRVIRQITELSQLL